MKRTGIWIRGVLIGAICFCGCADKRQDASGKMVRIKNLSPRQVSNLQFHLIRDGKRLEDLIPGEPVVVEVVVTDRENRTYSTERVTTQGKRFLGQKWISVLSDLADYDPESRELIPNGNPAKVKQGYHITLRYGDPAKPDQFSEVKQLFPADMNAVLGPPPENVTQISFTVDNRDNMRFLVPGRKYPLAVTVLDRNGRYYTTGRKPPLIPLNRLDLKLDKMSWQPRPLSIIGDDDFAKTKGHPYKVRVIYRGGQNRTAEKAFIADFAALRGPEPDEVKSFSIQVGKEGAKGIVPGSSVPLVASAIGPYGRTFSTKSKTLKLPVSRLDVSTSPLWRFHRQSGALICSIVYKKLVGQKLEVTATYKGRDDLKVTESFSPDLVSHLLQKYGHKERTLEFQGQVGASGEDGRGGRSGDTGKDDADEDGTGESGDDGGNGSNGQSGQRGGLGPRVRVAATEVMTLDKAHRLLLILVDVRDKSRCYLSPIGHAAFRIIASGGAGGSGGKGGMGGEGGGGGIGEKRIGPGGRGGDGGHGGPGGHGGQGGSIDLHISSQKLQLQLLLSVPGGPGGKGGHGGPRGKGGNIDEDSSSLALLLLGTALKLAIKDDGPKDGSRGSRGREGGDGRSGRPGREGRINVNVIPQIWQAIKQRTPPYLREKILFVDDL